MSQHLWDSMRFLYKKEETSCEDILKTSHEAQGEWTENKSIRVKNVTVTENDGLKALKEQISSLASVITVSQSPIKGKGPKMNGTQKGKRDQDRKLKTKGPRPTPMDCSRRASSLYNVLSVGGGDTWHVSALLRECELEESEQGGHSSSTNRPCNTKKAIEDICREGDHMYHNPDPLY